MATGAWLSGCGLGQSPNAGGRGGTEATPGKVGAAADELGGPLTSFADVTRYNNFYEFTLPVRRPARDSPGRTSKARAWTRP